MGVEERERERVSERKRVGVRGRRGEALRGGLMSFENGRVI